MTDEIHPVRTVVREGEAFIARHDLTGPAALMGGLMWGLLRAVAECPHCPGVFRTPQDEDWTVLVCPRCGGVWAATPDPQDCGSRRGRRHA